MAEVSWIKLYLRMFDSSRKIKRIENMPNGDTILIIWIKLLCLAGNINDGGAIYITYENPYDVESLADELRRPEELVEVALSVFTQFGMIKTDKGGIIHITSWEKYQSVDKLSEIREQNRNRKRRQREKEKQETSDDVSRDSHVTVTGVSRGCHATEEDIEEETEEDEDKEFHSIIHSGENSVENIEELKREYINGTLGKGVLLLSEAQFNDLLDKLSFDEFNKYIDIVVDCELNGKKYRKKTHYQAILDMVAKDRKLR